MKVLLTGASGLLGRSILSNFAHKKDFEVVGTAFSRLTGNLQKLDLCDYEQVKSFMLTGEPDIVVHCAAERRPDIVDKDPEKAVKLNVGATENLATLCSKQKTLLIYISTDYVFDGKNPPYEVNDQPNPLNTYGQTKLSGENCVKSMEGLKWCILRVPVLYGETGNLEESAITVLYSNLMKSVNLTKVLKMDHIQRRYPTYCDDIAQFVHKICSRYEQDGEPIGTLHFTGSECYTKYEMTLLMAKLKGVSTEFIEADTDSSSQVVPRPYDCQLSMKKCLELGLDFKQTTLEHGLKIVLKDL